MARERSLCCVKGVIVGLVMAWGLSEVASAESQRPAPPPLPLPKLGASAVTGVTLTPIPRQPLDEVPATTEPARLPAPPTGGAQTGQEVTRTPQPITLPRVEPAPQERVLVVAPSARGGSRFARLRRSLPYGLTDDPIIRFLTDPK